MNHEDWLRQMDEEQQERKRRGNEYLLDWARQTLFYTVYERGFNKDLDTDYATFLNATQDIVTEQLDRLIKAIVQEYGDKAVEDLWNAGLAWKTLEFVRNCPVDPPTA